MESSQNALAILSENSRKISKHFGYFLWSFTENNTYPELWWMHTILCRHCDC